MNCILIGDMERVKVSQGEKKLLLLEKNYLIVMIKNDI